MDRAAINSEIRSLSRRVKELRRKLRVSPAEPFKGETRKEAKMKRLKKEMVTRLDTWWDCLNRSDNGCEFCGKIQQLEPHHLEGGIGRRRQEESVKNLMAVCRNCHEEFHRNPRDFVRAVHDWCAKHGYPLPRRKEYR